MQSELMLQRVTKPVNAEVSFERVDVEFIPDPVHCKYDAF